MKTDTTYWRKMLNMSQAEFAGFLGVSLRTVQNWDYRHSMPWVITALLSKYYTMAKLYVIYEEKLLEYPQAGQDETRIRDRIVRMSKGGL